MTTNSIELKKKEIRQRQFFKWKPWRSVNEKSTVYVRVCVCTDLDQGKRRWMKFKNETKEVEMKTLRERLESTNHL